jgi:GTP-binding protein YchF
MGFRCGIVGMPNVGKSTLFNALTATQSAEAANYPFCTIEPNVGRVAVPDSRLPLLAEIAQSQQTLYTQIEFVDIAGLVAGASKGEGLGNQFLAHIREVDAIVHVLRCFDDPDITHVAGSVDPLRDRDIVETELLLADMESVERRIPALEKKARGGDKEAIQGLEILRCLQPILQAGKPARTLLVDRPEWQAQLRQLQLLTAKPVLYVANVLENEAATGNDYSRLVDAEATRLGCPSVTISSAIEAEITQLESLEERQEFLESLGLKETGLAKLIRSGYAQLELITFFTLGPKEARAWTVTKGASAPKAAAVIHTDFEKGFIRAETIAYNDYLQYHGEQGAKEAGKMRLEGKEYVVQDGDILHFRFNT